MTLEKKKTHRPDRKEVSLNFRCTNAQKKVMCKLANKYADGNLTKWVIFAATMLEPRGSAVNVTVADKVLKSLSKT